MTKLAATLVLTLTVMLGSAFTTEAATANNVQATAQAQASNVQAKVTWYAAFDNDPPGSREIAYPKSDGFRTIHNQAGGKGTFADPVSAATRDHSTFPIGTRVYYPPVKRYFVIEDLCGNCTSKWIDFYAGNALDRGVLACENRLTPNGRVTVIVNPPSNLAVDTTPIYSNGRCYKTS